MELPRRQRDRRYRRLDPADRDQARQIAGLTVGLALLLLEVDFRGRPGLQVTRALNHAVLPIWNNGTLCWCLLLTPIEAASAIYERTSQSRVNYNRKWTYRACRRRGIVGNALWEGDRDSAIVGGTFDEYISAILSPVTGDITRLHFSPLTSHAAKCSCRVADRACASLSVRKKAHSFVPPVSNSFSHSLPELLSLCLLKEDWIRHRRVESTFLRVREISFQKNTRLPSKCIQRPII